MKQSTVMGVENLAFIAEKLGQGDNVVLISNQQTVFDAIVSYYLLNQITVISLLCLICCLCVYLHNSDIDLLIMDV